MIRSKREHLHATLRDAIAEGSYPPGSKLPSEQELVRRFALSRSTVRAALGDLELAGLVQREHGRGSFVSARAGELLRAAAGDATRELRVSAVLDRHALINPVVQTFIRLLQRRLPGLARLALHYHERPHPERYPDADVILADAAHDLAWLEAVAPAVPVVVWNGTHPRLTSVVTDNEAGGALTAQHLVDLGHREIGLIHSVGEDRNREFARRLRAAGRVFERAGVAVHPEAIALQAQHKTPVERAVARLLERSAGRITALHCDTDLIAVRAIEALGDLGRRVPTDCSVTGFDDQPTVDQIAPPLTTVRQDLAALADRLVTILERLRAGYPPDTSPPIWPRLIVRASTGPPPGARPVS